MVKRSISLTVLAGVLFLLAGCTEEGPRSITDARSGNGLAYDLLGEGPLVVLIHGTNLDRRMWDGEVAWLTGQARVLRYDLRGQGDSETPTNPYSNHEDLLELLDELGEEEVSLIGLSAGAQVALDVALEAPNRVRRMILVSPSLTGYVPEERPPFFSDLSDALQDRDFARANEVLLASPMMSVPPKFENRVRAMVEDNSRLWTIPRSLIEQPSPPALERLNEIRAPALILVGTNDLEMIRAQGRLLERRLDNGRLVTVSGGGHLLNMTSPNSFRENVSGFLGGSED